MNNKDVVFMQQVTEFYRSTVQSSGEKSRMVRDDLTLKRYIFPSLVVTGIVPQIGSR